VLGWTHVVPQLDRRQGGLSVLGISSCGAQHAATVMEGKKHPLSGEMGTVPARGITQAQQQKTVVGATCFGPKWSERVQAGQGTSLGVVPGTAEV